MRKINGSSESILTAEVLAGIRSKQKRQLQMEESIHNVIMYLVYLLIITVIAYGQRDPMAFRTTQHIRDNLIDGPGGLSRVRILY